MANIQRTIICTNHDFDVDGASAQCKDMITVSNPSVAKRELVNGNLSIRGCENDCRQRSSNQSSRRWHLEMSEVSIALGVISNMDIFTRNFDAQQNSGEQM